MEKQSEEWLAELAREGKLASDADVPLAVRGLDWEMEIAIEGDFTGYTLLGRISSAPDTSALAIMDVLGPVVDGDYTLWRLSLPGSGGTYNTEGLATYADLPGVDRYLFMLILAPPVDPAYLLLGGVFPLLRAF